MAKWLLVALLVIVALSFSSAAFCEEKDFPKEKIISIATESAKIEGINISEADIIYDEDGKLWSERLGVAGFEDKTPNHGILKKGFLKNYRIVYFDFKEPIKDVWVFIDRDSGEVLTVYRE
jgi:hypothetical protein